jgi:hypothetical protein
LFAGNGPRESPFFVSEQLAFQQRFSKSGAIKLDKSIFVTRKLDCLDLKRGRVALL